MKREAELFVTKLLDDGEKDPFWDIVKNNGEVVTSSLELSIRDCGKPKRERIPGELRTFFIVPELKAGRRHSTIARRR